MRVEFDDTLGNRKRPTPRLPWRSVADLMFISARHVVRAIRVDYLPTFFNSTRQDNIRVGAGVKD